MRTAEEKTPAAAGRHTSPFFDRGSVGHFFGTKPEPNTFFQKSSLSLIQPKLAIGQPNDKYEKEADAVATQVVSSAAPVVQPKCAECEKEESLQKQSLPEEEELQMQPVQDEAEMLQTQPMEKEEDLQMKPSLQLKDDATSAVRTETGSEIQNKIYGSRGSGRPLESHTRSFMENRMQTDFSRVNIHTGDEAVQMNRELGARAFTVGSDIYFNKGEYRPETNEGKKLLAHELTHTVQQRGSYKNNSGSLIQFARDVTSNIIGEPGAPDEEGQSVRLYTLHESPIEIGTEQIYSIAFSPSAIPEGLSYYWMVVDNATDRPVYTQRTNRPTVRIRASTPGSYLVYVSIRQNGEILHTNTGGNVFLQINQRVGLRLPNEDENLEGSGLQGLAQHTLPSCNQSGVIEIDQTRIFQLGQIDRPAVNCSFTPIFHIGGGSQSVILKAHASNPPAGDWRMTIFECPTRLNNDIACDRNFGSGTSVAGRVSNELTFHYDPSLWVSRNIFIRIRNGALTPISNAALTLEPQFRNPIIQTIHDALSILGLIPGLGIVPDAIDTSIYLIEGDWGGAAMSAAAMVPAFGQGATVVRLGSRDVIRVHRSEVQRLGREGIQDSLRRIRQEGSSDSGSTMRRNRGLDLDVEETVESIVEESRTTTRPAQRPRLRRPSSSGRAASARTSFDRIRDGYASRLGVSSGGQVHHAIELQVLDRYPRVFTESQLNAFENMRGIGTELERRRQLHNSSIRRHWDRHYRQLDAEIQRRGLRENTPEYNNYVRQYLESAKNEIDYIMGQFFTEYRTSRPRSYE